MTMETWRAPRAPIYGGRAMVVSGHSAASHAGIETLRRGGSVVDAMISASAALAVVLGQANSIGGDCFVLYRDGAADKTVGLNASGRAPALATPDRYAGGMPAKGPLAPVVPGLVRAWEQLHRRGGRLHWKGLFDRAIELAEAYPVSHVLADRAAALRADIEGDAGCSALYLPGGRPIAVGEMLRQPALAATLRAIAEQGADAFYLGAIADRLDGFFTANGGLIRAADLAAYQPEWVEPLATDYRGHRVEVMPPNSYGALLLMQLNGLSGVPGERLNGSAADRMAAQMSAMRAAFGAGLEAIADPASAMAEMPRLLGTEMTATLQAAVRDGVGGGRVPTRGGTSCLMVADADGTAITCVQSVFNVFGGALLDPATGIIFNNRMTGFSHLPGPNQVGPGRRPAHTLCPVMVSRDGRVRFTLASPGGSSQTLTNTQVLTNLIDRGMNVAAAVEAPRWCTTRTGDCIMEGEFPESLIDELARLGHPASRQDDSYYYGSAKAIEFLSQGTLAGAADHRREAFALGI